MTLCLIDKFIPMLHILISMAKKIKAKVIAVKNKIAISLKPKAKAIEQEIITEMAADINVGDKVLLHIGKEIKDAFVNKVHPDGSLSLTLKFDSGNNISFEHVQSEENAQANQRFYRKA